MRGGKNIKPEHIKIAEGTSRADRRRANPPVSAGVPKCPFKAKTVASRKWKEVVTGLKRLGLIDTIDLTHIEGLCRNYQIAKQADRVIDREGIVITGVMGGLVANPACSVSAKAWGAVRQYGNELGLNHLSRQRMESTATQVEDDIESKYLA
jgi:P27 family predicted phage terminase small subunit